jgi:hypothetical protein
MITVLTTVAQHREGLDLHLRNLKWALSNFDHQIIVQSFKSYELKGSAEFVLFDENPNNFFFFWDHAHKIILDTQKSTDLYLFMEQDILFAKKPDEQIINSTPIKINFDSDYLSIFNLDKNKIYPRIWEGATFIEKQILVEAIKNKVTLGSHGKWIKNSKYFTTKSNIKKENISIQNYLKEKFFDTLFEFTYYCFSNKLPYKSWSKIDYEMNDYVVHFRGIDMMCHDKPSIYENLKDTLNIFEKNNPDNLVWKRLLNNCSLMLLLSGVHPRSSLMEKNLKNNFMNSRFLIEKKIKKIIENSKDWMTNNQFDSLIWANKMLEEKCLML